MHHHTWCWDDTQSSSLMWLMSSLWRSTSRLTLMALRLGFRSSRPSVPCYLQLCKPWYQVLLVLHLHYSFFEVVLTIIGPLHFQMNLRISFFFFFFLVGLGFELRASHLQSRCCTTYCLSSNSTPFCSSYFGDGSFQLFAQAVLELLSSQSQPPSR
jgi:hypothetical protein